VLVYIAPTASNGVGDVWIKLAEAGYDGAKWAVDDLIANKGKHDVVIPAGLATGEYLVRGELITLHEADVAYTANPARGAQLYMECVQIKVTGSGTTVDFTFLFNKQPPLTWNLADSTCWCGHSRCLQRSRSRHCIQSIRVFHFLHYPWPGCLERYQRWFRICFSSC
jgi:hypothetical protein